MTVSGSWLGFLNFEFMGLVRTEKFRVFLCLDKEELVMDGIVYNFGH